MIHRKLTKLSKKYFYRHLKRKLFKMDKHLLSTDQNIVNNLEVTNKSIGIYGKITTDTHCEKMREKNPQNSNQLNIEKDQINLRNVIQSCVDNINDDICHKNQISNTSQTYNTVRENNILLKKSFFRNTTETEYHKLEIKPNISEQIGQMFCDRGNTKGTVEKGQIFVETISNADEFFEEEIRSDPDRKQISYNCLDKIGDGELGNGPVAVDDSNKREFLEFIGEINATESSVENKKIDCKGNYNRDREFNGEYSMKCNEEFDGANGDVESIVKYRKTKFDVVNRNTECNVIINEDGLECNRENKTEFHEENVTEISGDNKYVQLNGENRNTECNADLNGENRNTEFNADLNGENREYNDCKRMVEYVQLNGENRNTECNVDLKRENGEYNDNKRRVELNEENMKTGFNVENRNTQCDAEFKEDSREYILEFGGENKTELHEENMTKFDGVDWNIELNGENKNAECNGQNGKKQNYKSGHQRSKEHNKSSSKRNQYHKKDVFEEVTVVKIIGQCRDKNSKSNDSLDEYIASAENKGESSKENTSDIGNFMSGGNGDNDFGAPLRSVNKIEILFEDDNYVIVNKPYDLVINSNDESDMNTLDCLLIKQKELELGFVLPKNKIGNHYFHYVHRLDYATSGIICLAKNSVAASRACQSFQYRLVDKHYLAILRGHLHEEQVTVDTPIGYDSRYLESNKMMCEAGPHCIKPRKSTTKVLLLETGHYQDSPVSKVLLKPVTGRRHQLRLHCLLLGHHVMGDFTYSGGLDMRTYRMFLHAHRLRITLMDKQLDITSPDPFNFQDEWETFRVFNTLDNIPSTF